MGRVAGTGCNSCTIIVDILGSCWNGPWITDRNRFPNRTHNFFQIFVIFRSLLCVLLSLLVCFFVFSAPFLCFAHSELGKNEKNRELRFLQI